MNRNSMGRPVALLGSLCVAIQLVGCASAIRGYAGPERAFAETARVHGYRTVVPMTSAAFDVTIDSVDGAAERHEWAAPSRKIELLPGRYSLEVSADWAVFVPAALLMKSNEADSTRSFDLAVEAGKTYEIHFERERKFFYVVELSEETRSQGDDTKLPPNVCDLAPTPEDRERCVGATAAVPPGS